MEEIKCPLCGANHEALQTYRDIRATYEVRKDGTPAGLLTETPDLIMKAKEQSNEFQSYSCDECDAQFKIKSCGFCEENSLSSLMYGKTEYYGQHGNLDEFKCPVCGQVELWAPGDTEEPIEVSTPGAFERIVKPCAVCGVEWSIDDLTDQICPDCIKNNQIYG